MTYSESERFRTVVLWLAGQTGKKQSEIGVLLGWNNKSAFSMLMNGKKKIPVGTIQKLVNLDERINKEYLLGTSDIMLIGLDSPATEVNSGGELSPPESSEQGDLYRELYKESQEENARLRRRVNQLLDLLQKMGSTCK